MSDSSGNLSVVSDEDSEVSSSSEDSVREDELETEHGSAVSRPLSSKRKSSITEDLKFPANSDPKINQSVKTSHKHCAFVINYVF